VNDEDEEVRNNAVYGLGVLAAYGGVESLGHYPVTLALLTKVMATESDERVRDNVCGAVCRMILTNPASVPVGEYLGGVVERLPLSTDVEENATVYRCLGELYGVQNPDVMSRLGFIVAAAGRLLSEGEVSDETKVILVQVVTLVGQRNPEVLSSVFTSDVDVRVKEGLQSCFPDVTF